MMTIPRPLAETIYQAYCELWEACKTVVDEPGLISKNTEIMEEMKCLHDGEALDDCYIKAARNMHQDGGSVEIDDGAVVSKGTDPGAYVEARVWVDNCDLENYENVDLFKIPQVLPDDVQTALSMVDLDGPCPGGFQSLAARLLKAGYAFELDSDGVPINLKAIKR